jgi:hypothetical protein
MPVLPRSSLAGTASHDDNAKVRRTWGALHAALAIQVVACNCEAVRLPAASVSDAAGPTDGGASQSPWSVLSMPAALTRGDIAVSVDGSGQPHVAFSESTENGTLLRHVWISGGEFLSETVDYNGRGRRKWWVTGSDDLRLVYDHIAFSIAAFSAVRRNMGGWNIDVATLEERSAGYTAQWTGGRLIAARQTAVPDSDDLQASLRHGLNVDGQALPISHTRLAAESVEPRLAMAADDDGVVHVVYSAPANDSRYVASSDGLLPQVLLWVRYDRGQWSTPEELTSTPGFYEGLSAAFDSKANLHVTFSELAAIADPESDPVPTLKMHHLRLAQGVWAREELSAVGKGRLSRSSMAVDAQDGLVLAFCVTESDSPTCIGVGYARLSDNGWRFERVDAGCDGVGEGASIALSGDGGTFIAYEGCGQQLRLAHKP